MERLPNDSLEWFLLRAEAMESLSSSASDKKAVEAARRLDPLPRQTEKDLADFERQLTELVLGSMYLEALRSALIFRATRMVPDDAEHVLAMAQSVYDRVAREHAELRTQARVAGALRSRATRVLAEASDPSGALRAFLDNLKAKRAG